jgi:RNA polymerase sigma-70 factor, ECF subfamily
MVVADQEAFAEQIERYRRELQVHCYRMLGSFDEAEDLVQETFLRAWRARETFEGRATLRAWLYRIATNACLDFLARHPRQPRPYQAPPGAEPSVDTGPPPFIPWLQPYPDRLLEPAAPGEDEPDAAVFAKETIELVFMVAIQHLPPKQRAAVILRDVLGWSANDTAAATDMSVPAVKSALQRARPVLKAHLPERRLEWEPAANATEQERALLERMMEVGEHGDAAAWAELVTEDIRLTMPPNELWFAGRDSIAAMLADTFDPQSPRYFGEWRYRLTRANRQPAAAGYIRRPGTTIFHGQTLDVMRIEGGRIAEITTFGAHLYPAFGLPMTL